MSPPDNRIIFVNSPWPKGHAIKEFVWSARIEPNSGIWFDLHLVTDRYDAEDARGDDEKGDVENWHSKTVWNNYHKCTISSIEWGHSGFLAGTQEAPLDFET